MSGSELRSRIRAAAAGNPFLVVAIVATALSCLATPPDREYADYLDLRTLVSLFCVLAVVRALDHVGFFTVAAEHVIAVLRTRRRLVAGLVGMTLVASMLITNDMALLTFLPLTVVTLRATGNEDRLAIVFVLETVAANLGGMITPFGSPQNLYLYQFYDLGLGEFLAIMAWPFALSVVLITGLCLLVDDAPHEPVRFDDHVRAAPVALYTALFVVTVAIVLDLLPVLAGAVVVGVLLVVDRRALARVDHGLMLTLALFFVLAGNLARMPEVADTLRDLLARDTLLVSALGSQVLSNVPTAILAAPFTDEHAQLLVGVNVGGVGTVVASLASLITLRQYALLRPDGVRGFLAVFTVVNVALLAVLLAATWVAFRTGLM